MQAKSRKQSPGRNMKIDPDLEVGAGDCLRLVISVFLQRGFDLPVCGIALKPRLRVNTPSFAVAA